MGLTTADEQVCTKLIAARGELQKAAGELADHAATYQTDQIQAATT